MNDRQNQLLDWLEQEKRISIREAARRLGVAEMTIRRDARLLEKRKALLQVRGGILIPCAVPGDADGPLDERAEVKRLIAAALYERIMPTESLLIGTGTTPLAFAKLLARRNRRPVTVLTNALPVAMALHRTPCRVILLGGELRAASLDLVGPVTERNLGEYQVNWLISGCDAADARNGFYTSDVSLSNLERLSLRIAQKNAIIADSGKFKRRSLTCFAKPGEVNLLVTDRDLSAEDRRLLEAARIETILA